MEFSPRFLAILFFCILLFSCGAEEEKRDPMAALKQQVESMEERARIKWETTSEMYSLLMGKELPENEPGTSTEAPHSLGERLDRLESKIKWLRTVQSQLVEIQEKRTGPSDSLPLPPTN